MADPFVAAASRLLPPPPSPFRTVSVAATDWYQVHRFDAATGKYAADAFNDTDRGDARFTPLRASATGTIIPTIYAASHHRAALAEILLHDVPTPSTNYLYDWEADKRRDFNLSKIALPALKLVNLTATGLQAAGLEW